MKVEIINGEHKGTVGQIVGGFPMAEGMTYCVQVAEWKFLTVLEKDLKKENAKEGEGSIR